MNTFGKYFRQIAGIGLALALVGGFAASAAAQTQMKGAQRLMKLETVQDLQKVEPGDTIIMSCPKCKDTYAQVVEKSFKGSKPDELKTVPIHLCSSCETKVVTEGSGKLAKDKLVHTCKMCGSEDVQACVLKKSDSAAPGMHDMH